ERPGTFRGILSVGGTVLGLDVFSVIFAFVPRCFALVLVLMALQFSIELFVARNYGLAVVLKTPPPPPTPPRGRATSRAVAPTTSNELRLPRRLRIDCGKCGAASAFFARSANSARALSCRCGIRSLPLVSKDRTGLECLSACRLDRPRSESYIRAHIILNKRFRDVKFVTSVILGTSRRKH
ncbi:FUSC family protein, partial [Nocardia cyriacigeorgica]|uniref:FUSC family protein n=1 Tax=Nocardia cyriacigeorgica TaxID=135487 RepID=UPI0024576007